MPQDEKTEAPKVHPLQRGRPMMWQIPDDVQEELDSGEYIEDAEDDED